MFHIFGRPEEANEIAGTGFVDCVGGTKSIVRVQGATVQGYFGH